MPTGYTAPVQDGKIEDFPTFALQCARAFGACVLMRDDPADKPIPEEFKPSDYHKDRLVELRDELAVLETAPEPFLIGAMQSELYKERDSVRKDIERRKQSKARYVAMLDKVNAWVPPTGDHRGLKEFMVQQLLDSIKWDCDGYEREPPTERPLAEWKAERIAAVKKSIAYHTEEHAEEIERTRSRNEWVQKLRESL